MSKIPPRSRRSSWWTERYLESFHEEAERTLDGWATGETFDLHREMTGLTMRIEPVCLGGAGGHSGGGVVALRAPAPKAVSPTPAPAHHRSPEGPGTDAGRACHRSRRFGTAMRPGGWLGGSAAFGARYRVMSTESNSLPASSIARR
jgi:hypothetical protein